MQYLCLGSLAVLVLVTLVNAVREWDYFSGFMKAAIVLHVLSGIILTIHPETKDINFMEWLGGGAVVFYGGAAVLFNLFIWFENRIEAGLQPEYHTIHHTNRVPDEIETIEGEIVDGVFMPLNAVNAQRVARLPAIAKTSRRIKFGGKGPLGRVIHMPLSDWKTCDNIERPHWHTYIDDKEVCEGE